MTLESIEETTTGEGFSADELDRIAEQFDPPSQALTEMVRRVANELELDVCSIYILEKDRQHLCLAATMGLNQSSVGHVRMKNLRRTGWPGSRADADRFCRGGISASEVQILPGSWRRKVQQLSRTCVDRRRATSGSAGRTDDRSSRVLRFGSCSGK